MAYEISSTEYEPSASLLEKYADEVAEVDEEPIDEDQYEEDIDETGDQEETLLDDESEDDENIYNIELDGEVVKVHKDELSKALKNKGSNIDDSDYKEYKELKPIFETIKSDDVLKRYMGYKSSGHSPKAIIEGMFLLEHPELAPLIQDFVAGRSRQQAAPAEEEMPEFDTVEEQVEWLTTRKVQQELQKALGTIVPNVQQLQQKQQQIDNAQTLEYVRRVNDEAMESALQENGYNVADLSKADMSAMIETMQALYPKVDFRTALIDKQQARIIIKAALGSKPKKAGVDTKAYVKQSKLPTIKPVGVSKRSNQTPQSGRQVDGVSKEERMRRIQEL